MRHKWLLVAVPVVVLGSAAGLAVAAVDYVKDYDIFGETIKDPRSCRESKISLDKVSRHFAVKLPADASEVRFHSSFRPLGGEQHLRLSFRTSEDGLRAFLTSGGFPQPLPGIGHTGTTSLRFDVCQPADSSLIKPYSTTHSRPYGKTGHVQRDVIMDLADRAHPRVVLAAEDLEG